MWKSLCYKEWLKLRLFFWFGLSVSVFIAILIWLETNQMARLQGEKFLWYSILYINEHYYKYFRFIPMVLGITFASFQFLPEVQSSRLKLTYHLPLSQAKSILIMTLFAITLQILIFAGSSITLTILTNFKLPTPILGSATVSMVPWFLTGIISYSAMVCTLLEPKWKIKVFFIFLGILTPLFPLQKSMMEGMNSSLLLISLITILWYMSIYFSAIRFSKVS